MLTEFLGEAWDRVMARLDARAMFIKKGWGLVVGDTNDNLVRMPELPNYSWSMDDFTDEGLPVSAGDDEEDAPEELATAEEEKDSDGDEASDDSSEEEDEEEVDPGPWQDTDTWQAVPTPTQPKAKLNIAHKFFTSTGWEIGRIVNKCRGSWAVKYPSETSQYVHDLNITDYGPDGVWVVVKKV